MKLKLNGNFIKQFINWKCRTIEIHRTLGECVPWNWDVCFIYSDMVIYKVLPLFLLGFKKSCWHKYIWLYKQIKKFQRTFLTAGISADYAICNMPLPWSWSRPPSILTSNQSPGTAQASDWARECCQMTLWVQPGCCGRWEPLKSAAGSTPFQLALMPKNSFKKYIN